MLMTMIKISDSDDDDDDDDVGAASFCTAAGGGDEKDKDDDDDDDEGLVMTMPHMRDSIRCVLHRLLWKEGTLLSCAADDNDYVDDD